MPVFVNAEFSMQREDEAALRAIIGPAKRPPRGAEAFRAACDSARLGRPTERRSRKVRSFAHHSAVATRR
ncbi:MAG: hypothetical protein EA385_09720 [Salinarimonadaceae bacterium]|nr:MAG: hypothetical protein EA385_09720 [Salinarimonadaceae bacterium]